MPSWRSMFLAVADLHLSNTPIMGRDRLKLGLQLLDECFWLAEERGLRDLFVIGDLLDAKNKIQKETLIGLYRLLLKHHQRGRVRLHWIRGNHESFDRADPEQTLMDLYSEVCHVVSKPEIVSTSRIGHVFCLPWYPADTFKRYSLELAKVAGTFVEGPKVLMFHAGLREGRISFSNIQPPQRLNGFDLVPDRYDMCLGGDYHMFQQLRDYENIFYLSAPVPMTFGDEGNRGPWLVDPFNSTLEDLVLPTRYPSFQKWILSDDGDLSLPGYRAEDYNRIFAPEFLHAKLSVLYPGAQVLRLQKEQRQLELAGSRLAMEDVQDMDLLLSRWMEKQGLDSAHRELYHTYGKELLTDG
jgi:hypothetical protein